MSGSAETPPIEQGVSEGRRWWSGSATASDDPTDAADYALLNSVFIAGLGGTALLAHLKERRGRQPIPLREVPLLAAATYALAQVLAKEKVTTWLREPFVEEGGDHRPVRPEGDGLRYAVGELLTCTRCLGAWAALGLTALRTAAPAAGRTASTVLAVAGANNFLQAGFRLLTAKTNVLGAQNDGVA